MVAVSRFLELLRTVRAVQAALGGALGHAAAEAERASRKAETLQGRVALVQDSAARLRESTRRLAVLLSAWSEARSTFAGFAFVPRK